jgi:Ras homolog enriched in brain
MAEETGLAWIETSAKSNANVAAVFDLCLEEIEKAMHPERATDASGATANGSAGEKKAPNKGNQCIIM